MRYIDKMWHMFQTVSALIPVNIWKIPCNYFIYLPIPPNVKYGTRLPMCMECVAPNFNMVWYEQVLEICACFYLNFHSYYGTKSYEHVPNLFHITHCKQKWAKKLLLQSNLELVVIAWFHVFVSLLLLQSCYYLVIYSTSCVEPTCRKWIVGLNCIVSIFIVFWFLHLCYAFWLWPSSDKKWN